jgi:hypothetical protein
VQRMTPRRTSLRLTKSKPQSKSFFVLTYEILLASTGIIGLSLSQINSSYLVTQEIALKTRMAALYFPLPDSESKLLA